MDGLTVGTDSLVGQPDEMSEALDSDLKFTTTGTNDATWIITSGSDDEYYYEADAMRSYDTLSDGEESCLQTIVESDSAETLKFYWMVSCQATYDYLEFYIDGTRQDRITGNVGWQEKSYSVSSGIHILKWRYISGGDS